MAERYELPLFPLNTVLFPGMMLPLHIFEQRYKDMMDYCLSNSEPFGVILLRSGHHVGPLTGELFDIGTVAEITQVNRLQGGRMNIVSIGHRRFKLHDVHHQNSYLTGVVEDYPLIDSDTPRTRALAQHLLQKLASYLKVYKQVGKLNVDLKQVPEDPETLAFLTAILLPVSNEEKQELLGIPDAPSILREEFSMLRYEATIMDILADEREIKQHEGSPFSIN